MSVEAERLDKRVEWLDEQRRKDVETLGRLAERLAAFEEALESHEQQMKSFMSELARLATLAPRLEALDDALAKHRKGLKRQLDEGQKRLIGRQKDLESLWKADQKQTVKSIDELRKELRGIEDLHREMATRQEEERRLRKSIEEMNADVERLLAGDAEHKQAMATLDESRALESRKVTELQASVLEMRKRADAQQGSLDLAGDSIRRVEGKIDEIISAAEELREAQRLWREQQASQLAEFEREWREWEKRFRAFEHRADEMDERFVNYEETFRALLQLKADLKEVIERLERRINEVSELQRLAADRFKQDWTAFKADDQKRWSGFQLASEERWKDHERRHERWQARMQDIEVNLDEALRNIAELAESSRGRVMEALAMMREWAADLDRKVGDAK